MLSIDNDYMIDIHQGRVGKRGLGGERVWGSPPSSILSIIQSLDKAYIYRCIHLCYT